MKALLNLPWQLAELRLDGLRKRLLEKLRQIEKMPYELGTDKLIAVLSQLQWFNRVYLPEEECLLRQISPKALRPHLDHHRAWIDIFDTFVESEIEDAGFEAAGQLLELFAKWQTSHVFEFDISFSNDIKLNDRNNLT